MESINFRLCVGLLCAPVALVIWRLSRIGKRPSNFPPGPPTLPILGNIHQVPQEHNYLQFQQWAQEYGPVYSLMLGQKVMVVLSSDQAVKDLLDKRSAIYSARPDMYMAQDVLSGGYRTLLMSNNETWRVARKLAHTLINIRAARTYVPYQDLESKALLMGLLEDPNEVIKHARRYAMSLTTQMTFGYRTPAIDDENLLGLFKLFEQFSDLSLSPGAALLDVYPILRKLPDILLPIRRQAKALHKKEMKLFKKYFLNTRAKLNKGILKPCCCIELIRVQKELGVSDEAASYLSGSFLQAGSETTSSAYIGFVQAMMIFPDVAKKAQKEIDLVCGDRLPDLNDAPDLPYVRGCVRECLRWMPPTPLGVPHAVTQDDIYNGYLIPKDAGVILNVWSVDICPVADMIFKKPADTRPRGIQNDPKRHSNPREFDPDRWTDYNESSADLAIHPDVSKRDHFAFGAGRRVCQGVHIADRSLFLAISRTLWAFDYKRAVDPMGQQIVPEMNDFADGMFICPIPFKADIAPRSEDRASLVRQAWAETLHLLDEDMQWKSVPEGLIWRDYEPDTQDNNDSQQVG